MAASWPAPPGLTSRFGRRSAAFFGGPGSPGDGLTAQRHDPVLTHLIDPRLAKGGAGPVLAGHADAVVLVLLADPEALEVVKGGEGFRVGELEKAPVDPALTSGPHGRVAAETVEPPPNPGRSRLHHPAL